MRVPGTKSMRVYSGGLSQRQYVPGEEGWQFTDQGTAVITSKRVVFMGQSKAIEWASPRLVALGADRSNNSLLLQIIEPPEGSRLATIGPRAVRGGSRCRGRGQTRPATADGTRTTSAAAGLIQLGSPYRQGFSRRQTFAQP
jgi:hypothetical protein